MSNQITEQNIIPPPFLFLLFLTDLMGFFDRGQQQFGVINWLIEEVIPQAPSERA